MKNLTLNAILLLAVAALLSGLASHVRVAASADRVVLIAASGTGCTGCLHRGIPFLEREAGVSAARVEGRGWAVSYDSRKVTPQRLAGTLSAAGFPCSMGKVLSAAEYRSATGHEPAAAPAARCCGSREEKDAGCGGTCNGKH